MLLRPLKLSFFPIIWKKTANYGYFVSFIWQKCIKDLLN